MRLFPSALAGLLILMLTPLSATEGDGPCVTLGSSVIFRTSDVVSSDSHSLDHYPHVKYSDDDSRRPIGLRWVLKGAEVEAESERIAEIGGREVRRFVFWQKGGHKTGDGLLCLWLGIEAPARTGGLGFRPFLVLDGDDQVSSWECFTSYDEDDKFTARLHMGLKGNGVFWETAIVQIQEHGAVPLRLERGGRGQEAPRLEIYHESAKR